MYIDDISRQQFRKIASRGLAGRMTLTGRGLVLLLPSDVRIVGVRDDARAERLGNIKSAGGLHFASELSIVHGITSCH